MKRQVSLCVFTATHTQIIQKFQAAFEFHREDVFPAGSRAVKAEGHCLH